MSGQPSAFGIAPTLEERQALLTDAADRIRKLSTFLGEGQTKEATEATLLEALRDDVACFARYPDVYRISDQDFLSQGMPVPVKLQELTDRFTFYWLYLPIALLPQHNWAFNLLEVAIEFNPGEADGQARPKAYQILPEQSFQTLIQSDIGAEVRLGGDLRFVATLPITPAAAGVDATLAADAGVIAGPFRYRLKKAKLMHTATGMELVKWRLDGTEFFQEDAPTLIVILQVPRETTSMQIACALEARRHFAFAAAGLQQKVTQFPKALKEFFHGGLPLRDTALWDLTPHL